MSDGKLVIFEAVAPADAEFEFLPDGRPVRARGLRDSAVHMVEVGADVMREGMASFIDGVSRMLEAAEKLTGEYAVEMVEIQCQISGDGKIGFAGTGLSLKGESSMKLVFKRNRG